MIAALGAFRLSLSAAGSIDLGQAGRKRARLAERLPAGGLHGEARIVVLCWYLEAPSRFCRQSMSVVSRSAILGPTTTQINLERA